MHGLLTASELFSSTPISLGHLMNDAFLILTQLDWGFILVGLVSVFITGVSKSGLGGGLGQLSVPILVFWVSPFEAVAILLPILCIIDLANLWNYRRDWSWAHLAILIPGALLGIGLGALTFHAVDENILKIILGSLMVVFAGTFFIPTRQVKLSQGYETIWGVFCGGLAGFTSFIAHAGGGPVKMYLLPKRLSVRNFMGTSVYFFFAINQLKIWPYFWLGQFTPQSIVSSFILLPAIPLGVWVGWRLVDRINPELFYKICYGLLFFAGIGIINSGISTFLQ